MSDDFFCGSLVEEEECIPETRDEYVKKWWKNHRENKEEMKRLINTLLFKHAKDDCEQQELEWKFHEMFATGPEPEPVHYDYDMSVDNHFHHAIGNQILMTENYWGQGGLYRIHKLYNVNSPCLKSLYKDDE